VSARPRPPAPRPARPRGLLPGLALLLLGLGPACGYSHGYGRPGGSIRRMAIEAVDNLSFRQGLDQDLTRQLGRDLTIYTGLVPATRSSADALLRVTLVEEGGRPISDAAEGAVEEAAAYLAVEVVVIDLQTGEEIYRGKHLDWAEFRAPVGEDLDSATRESVADLSRKILTAVVQVL